MDVSAYNLRAIPNGEDFTIAIEGPMALDNVQRIHEDIQSLLHGRHLRRLNLDLSRVNYFDSAGATLLIQLERYLKKKNVPVRFLNLPSVVKGFLRLD